MRFMLLFFWLAALVPLEAAESTALAALKLIPKDRAARLARIEARDGTPTPERWYFVVQDPGSESGVHEFVVSHNEVVASRAVSQFAESLKPDDVIGGERLKIDSDRAAKIAREYANANNRSVSKLKYQLSKDGADAAPVWRISCLDEKDKRIGEVTVTATKGNVISHDGFPVSPHATVETKKKAPKFEVVADPEIVKSAPAPSPGSDEESQPEANQESERRGHPVGNAVKSVGRGIRRFLPF